MTDFKDLLLKIANQGRLTPSELDDLARFGTETQLRNAFVAGNTTPDNRLSVISPMVLLYNERFEVAKASVNLNLPSDYNTLIIMGSGCIDQANGGNIWAQFNGDTGASNYAYQLISGSGLTAGATEDLTFHAVAIGLFGTTGAGAGVSGSFVAQIPGYSSAVWKKNVLAHMYTAEFNDQYLTGSRWTNTSPITSIDIFGTNNTLAKGTANMIAGSYISVWGMK